MKKILPFPMIILTIMAVACKKKNKEEDLPETVSSDESITISASNPVVLVVNFNPSRVLPWNYQKEYNFPLDLNGDTTPEFYVNYQINYKGGSSMYHESTRISLETLSSDSYVFCDSIYPKLVFRNDTLIEQSFVNGIYPKALSENDVIHKTDNWKHGKLNLLYHYDVYSNADPTNPIMKLTKSTYEGTWYMTDSKYVGIKYKDKLGWIKIGIDKGTIKIYEYAYSKN